MMAVETHVEIPKVVHAKPRRTDLAIDFGRRMALRALAPLFNCLGKREAQAFGILVYHRVAPWAAGAPRCTMNVTPRRFRSQMQGLLRRNFQPWPLRKVVEYYHARKRIPREVFVVTFDDGFECVYEYAWPILKELGIPATIFLATAYLDSERPFPFDDWCGKGSGRGPRSAWRPLSTRQCAEMLAGGLIDLGTHSHTHDDFRDHPEKLYDDLQVSLATLRERFGLVDATFAFPYGQRRWGFSGPDLAAEARRSGVLCGLSGENDLVRPQDTPFDWGRFSIEWCDTAAMVAARLNGWYGLVREAWHRLPSFRSKHCETA